MNRITRMVSTSIEHYYTMVQFDPVLNNRIDDGITSVGVMPVVTNPARQMGTPMIMMQVSLDAINALEDMSLETLKGLTIGVLRYTPNEPGSMLALINGKLDDIDRTYRVLYFDIINTLTIPEQYSIYQAMVDYFEKEIPNVKQPDTDSGAVSAMGRASLAYINQIRKDNFING